MPCTLGDLNPAWKYKVDDEPPPCNGDLGTLLMDSSNFRATCSGTCGGNIGWGHP